MSEDAECKTRTLEEETLIASLTEIFYLTGGTPDDFRRYMENDAHLAELYKKAPCPLQSNGELLLEDTRHYINYQK